MHSIGTGSRGGHSAPSLTIVIPALNEEQAIGGTIAQCLDARQDIQTEASLTNVEIYVVSDGSTDRTAEIAQSFPEVNLIIFEKNQGYGAAIKAGWDAGKGSMLAFLDADGTCDPRFFGPMCRIALSESADVVLGSRLGPGSEMPSVRRLGNHIYAFLLGVLCGRRVTDTASGMRVVQRSALKYLYPLPDGLHFTPSMSARAMLNDLRVVELPMSYKERIGTSKLSVLKDGIRFLRTILSGVLCYRPEKLLLFSFLLCIVIILALAAYPTEYYLRNRRLEEWMIYRFVACQLLGIVGLLMLLATALINRVALFGPRRLSAIEFWPFLIARILQGRVLVAVLIGWLAVALGFLWPGILQYGSTLHITLHWSRLLAGSFALLAAAQTAVFALLIKVVSLWIDQRIAVDEPLPLKDKLVTAINETETDIHP